MTKPSDNRCDRPPATSPRHGLNMDGIAPDGADRRVLLLHPRDNCLIACAPIPAGTRLRLDAGAITVSQAIALGHKIARHALRRGDKVLRYGAIIGSVTRDVAAGEHLHTHNLKSDYLPTYTLADGERFVAVTPPLKGST